ncbi:MAG: hypothetical protein HKN83_11055, partial [Gammaproteobacteria bacterium]|nr:hypothetical protein [Gammaproteobacteria bacterium]
MKTQIRIIKSANAAWLIFFFASSILFSNNLWAKDPARVIAGWVEKVRIDNQDFDVKAKLDTGARTSSINARNIQSFKINGARWV